jgi:hypothetical protein
MSTFFRHRYDKCQLNRDVTARRFTWERRTRVACRPQDGAFMGGGNDSCILCWGQPHIAHSPRYFEAQLPGNHGAATVRKVRTGQTQGDPCRRTAAVGRAGACRQLRHRTTVTRCEMV